MRKINKIALTIVFDYLSHWITMPLPLNPIHSCSDLDIKMMRKEIIHRLKQSLGKNNIDQSILNIRSQKEEIVLKFLTALGTTLHIINRGLVLNCKRLQAINTA